MFKHDPESEYLTVKQEQPYVDGDTPDIGPNPLNTTDHRGSKRHQPQDYSGAIRTVSYPPQYYYTNELPRERTNVTRFKPEPPNDPT